jgi:hypothetical protein
MEGRVQLVCGDCGRTSEIAGELPDEYRTAFIACIEKEGWVPRPGAHLAFLCGACAATYAGHESVDDEKKVLSPES